MSDMNAHKKALVSAVIIGARNVETNTHTHLAVPSEKLHDKEETEHGPCDTCVATGLFFPHDQNNESASVACNCVTWSNYGPLWMGLWMGDSLILHDGENAISRAKEALGIQAHGNALFPRWLAEVLNLHCELDIQSEDIYDT